jgi:hypothetical protein
MKCPPVFAVSVAGWAYTSFSENGLNLFYSIEDA